MYHIGFMFRAMQCGTRKNAAWFQRWSFET